MTTSPSADVAADVMAPPPSAEAQESGQAQMIKPSESVSLPADAAQAEAGTTSPPAVPASTPSADPPKSISTPEESKAAAQPVQPAVDLVAAAPAASSQPAASATEDAKGKRKAQEASTSSKVGLATLLITGNSLVQGLRRQKDPGNAEDHDDPWAAFRKQPPMVPVGTRLLRSVRNPEAAQRELERIKRQKEVYMKMERKLEQVGQSMQNDDHMFWPLDPLVYGDRNETAENSGHILAGEGIRSSDSERADKRYKLQQPLKCALLFTDCTDTFLIEDPPEDPHKVLQHNEVNRFLSVHGLPPFLPDTYKVTFLPGCSEMGIGAPDDHWERNADCVIVLRPRDYNALTNKTNALKHLNETLLHLELDQVKYLEACRRFMETFFHWKSQGVKDDGKMLADLTVRLEMELRDKTENLIRKDTEVKEKTSTILMLESQLKIQMHALEACKISLNKCQDRSRWIEHKYDVVSASMFKIWVRVLLERVRKRIADDLKPYAQVIRFSRDHHGNMCNWHVTLRDIRNQPEACWLLADRGLDETLVELTRMSSGKDNIFTLHQIANMAAHSARDEEIAEAITSKTMEEYKVALEKLFRYARGSDIRIEELKNDL